MLPVLYINKQDIYKARKSLSNIYKCVKNVLNENTPLFAKRLAPGMSLAEDPGSDESFGQIRCRMFAEAIYSAHQKNIISLEAILNEVTLHFQYFGLSLEKPYLNPGSTDNYEFLITEFA